MGLVRGRRAKRKARKEQRSPGRRRLRRLVILGGIAGAVGTLRNKKIEENRRRFDLP